MIRQPPDFAKCGGGFVIAEPKGFVVYLYRNEKVFHPQVGFVWGRRKLTDGGCRRLGRHVHLHWIVCGIDPGEDQADGDPSCVAVADEHKAKRHGGLKWES